MLLSRFSSFRGEKVMIFCSKRSSAARGRSEKSYILRWHGFPDFFPRATSVGFSFSRLTAGVETRFPRTCRTGTRTIDSYITRWKKSEKYRKTIYFYQGFQVFGRKKYWFFTAKDRRRHAGEAGNRIYYGDMLFLTFFRAFALSLTHPRNKWYILRRDSGRSMQ